MATTEKKDRHTQKWLQLSTFTDIEIKFDVVVAKSHPQLIFQCSDIVTDRQTLFSLWH